jgi:4Fe-4S dicluster domain
VTGCPYKKIYFNHKTGKAEKCTFCYPRVEVGLPTVCSETCVGRLRYLGLFLYDADRVRAAAATPSEKDLYAAQLDLILDPNDPQVVAAARQQGIPPDWLDAARRSPVYALAKTYTVALPLHPEYRTMPMVWYIPPLSVFGFFLGIAGTTFAVGIPFVNAWFESARRGFATGVFGAGTGGTALSAFFTPRLVRSIGYVPTHLIIAAALVILGALLWLLMRDSPAWKPMSVPTTNMNVCSIARQVGQMPRQRWRRSRLPTARCKRMIAGWWSWPRTGPVCITRTAKHQPRRHCLVRRRADSWAGTAHRRCWNFAPPSSALRCKPATCRQDR